MQSPIISCSSDNIAGGVGAYYGGGLLSTLLALDSVRMRSNPQAPSTRTTVPHAPSTCDLLPPWQTVQDCTARAAGGVNIEGPAELVDCRILRCHAREYGGGLYVGGSNAFAKMTGGTISECSATYGGGVSTSTTRAEVSLVNVLITKCRATGDAEDKDPANGDGHGGGGVHVCLNAVFTMTGGSIRDCEATGGGGLRVTGDATQVRLRRMTLQRCTHRHHFLSWPNSAGCIYISDGNVSLIDVSLEECGSDDMCIPYALSHSGGTLHAERVRVRQPNPNFPVILGCRVSAVFCAMTRQGISKWTDSVISDCPGV